MEEEAKSIYDQAVEYLEDVPKTLGGLLGTLAFYIAKPLDQVHKHTTEPFIDEFMKKFNDGQ